MLNRCSLGHDLRSVPHGFECQRPGCGHVVYRVASLQVLRVGPIPPPRWMFVLFYLILAIGAVATAYGLLA